MRRPTKRDGCRSAARAMAQRAEAVGDGRKRESRVAGDGRARGDDGRMGWDGMRWSEMGLDENGDGGRGG